MDMSAIVSVFTSLKSASDLAKAMIGVRDAVMLDQKAIELTGVILSAQQQALTAQASQFALIDAVNDLKAKVVELEAWAAEKERYQLTEIGIGVFAFLVKPEMRGSEPAHCLCAACFHNGKKAVLQAEHLAFEGVRLTCPACKTAISPDDSHPNYPFARKPPPEMYI